MFPDPEALMPVTVVVLSLVHANVVPGILLVIAISVIVFPEHIVWDKIGGAPAPVSGLKKAAEGRGLTVAVKVAAGPVQPFAEGVMV